MRRLHRAADPPGPSRPERTCATPVAARRPVLDALFGRWSGEVDRLGAHGNLRSQRALDRVYHLVGTPAGLLRPALLAAAVRVRLLGLPTPVPRPPLTPGSAQRDQTDTERHPAYPPPP
jgi:hypothetical protein